MSKFNFNINYVSDELKTKAKQGQLVFLQPILLNTQTQSTTQSINTTNQTNQTQQLTQPTTQLTQQPTTQQPTTSPATDIQLPLVVSPIKTPLQNTNILIKNPIKTNNILIKTPTKTNNIPIETNPPANSTSTNISTSTNTYSTSKSFVKTNLLLNQATNNSTLLTTTSQPTILPNNTSTNTTQNVKILREFSKAGYERTISTFTSYFRSRYQKLSAILKQEHMFDKPVCSIHNLVQNYPSTIIGIVYEIKKLPNSYRVIVEDLTGTLNIVIPANNIAAFEKTKNIFTDMVLAFTGVLGGRNTFFCDDIIFPDVPIQNSHKQQIKKPDVSFVFISDLHIGSKNFLKKSFQHFVDWVCGHYDGTLGVEASKIAVIFVLGDLVSGINIYQTQQNDLLIQDLKKQYDEVARYFSKIPDSIKIVIIPGNHDAQRLLTPQPPIMASFASSLYDLKNVIMTSSPSWVSAFGVTVLLDHGTGISVLAEKNSDFNKMLASEPQELGKYLLQARHLYPLYGEARGVLSPEREDFLVIDKIPDIFAFGHIHSCGYMNYRGVHIINPGCFEGMTAYEEKAGLTPNPGWAYVYNLATDSVMALCFLDDDEKDLAKGINLKKETTNTLIKNEKEDNIESENILEGKENDLKESKSQQEKNKNGE